ncbi:hypothetical protein [Burkholderia pseudomallei]|uniref:hypothetical protein n=1 Tax=Burkholderia pseudomallei TaxID=28450 RepID=UPI00193D3600|nr:hypothetical protein [Burkholderia pseudomallei]QRM23537.1 hypothetical protein JQX71_04430 [Burkholderia pseudomallei]
MKLKQIGIDDWNDGKPLFYDADEFPGEVRWVADRFLIRLVSREGAYVEFKVFEGASRYSLEDKTGWLITGDGYSDDYLSASFKFDGCSHFNIGEDGYLHLCGGLNVAKHLALMRSLYDWAFELLNEEHDFSHLWDKECVDALFGGAQ